jgi:hypothetical protein
MIKRHQIAPAVLVTNFGLLALLFVMWLAFVFGFGFRNVLSDNWLTLDNPFPTGTRGAEVKLSVGLGN